MSTKLSFFEVPGFDAAKLEQITNGIDEERFGVASSSGFLIDKRSTVKVEGRYIQRIQASEVLTDPFGAEYKQETLHFGEQRFALSSSSPHLIIFNSTSLLRTLIGRLSEFSEFTIAFKDLRWSPENVLAALLIHAPDANVLSAKVENLRLSTGIQARMVFVGVGQDLRADAKKFLRMADVVFSSLKIEYTLAGSRRICEIRNNGVIQNYGDYDPAITEFWLKTVQDIAKTGD